MALLTAERIYLGERYPTYRNRGEEIDVSSLDLHYRPEIPGDRVISVPAHHSTDVAEGSRPVPAMAGNSSLRIELAVQSFNLDFLRSVAVLLVIGFHLAKLFNWQFGRLRVTDFGLLGVMLFFVHTTVALMFSLERPAREFERATVPALHGSAVLPASIRWRFWWLPSFTYSEFLQIFNSDDSSCFNRILVISSRIYC